MEIIKSLLMVVEVICALLLIGVILLQRAKNEGAGLAFGAGVGEQFFGSRAGNVLTKITAVLAIVFLADTMVLTTLYARKPDKSLMSQPTPSTAPVAPATGAAPDALPPLGGTEPPPAATPDAPAAQPPATTSPPAPPPATVPVTPAPEAPPVPAGAPAAP